jgi:uroporphyrinogen-III synthase
LKDNKTHSIPEKKSIISLQPAERALELHHALQDLPVKFYNMPMIYTQSIGLTGTVKSLLQQLPTFDLVIFTSRNGVKAFFELLQKAGIPSPLQTKIAVIGAGTAKELQQVYRPADFVQPGNTSRDFATYLIRHVLTGKEKVLLALGNLAPDFLKEALSSKTSGIHRINVYQTLPVEDYDIRLMQMIRQNKYGLLVCSSPSSFAHFYDLYQKEETEDLLRIVSIGQITTQAILHTTRAQVFTAAKPGTAGLMNVIKKYFHLKN